MTSPGPLILGDYLELLRREVDTALDGALPSAPDCPAVIAEAMRYSLMAGGKRLRPVLTLATADAILPACANARDLAMPVACAIEMIHTYSLIHDDLPAMDNDTLRRGKPTLHVVYGEGVAILAGDALLADAFAQLARRARSGDATTAARAMAAIERLAAASGSAGMVGGQVIDLQAAGQAGAAITLDASGLRDMHARKTGALIRAAAVGGAIMAGGSPEQIRAIDNYAIALGLAFQIVDDILDVVGSREELGKTIGKDAAASKPTYPAMFGLDASRRMANDAADTAIAALTSADLARDWLNQIARWVVSRTS